MKTLICKSCGGNLKKEGDAYLCKSCSNKYEIDIEEIQTQIALNTKNSSSSSSKTKKIALYGIWAALFFVVLTLETYFTKWFLFVPPAILSIPIIMLLALSNDWKTGLTAGVIFGVASNLVALIVADACFIFPWVAILPRLFGGIGAYGAYNLINKFTSKSKNVFVNRYLAKGVGTVVGVLINTTLVIACLWIFCKDLFGTFASLISVIITINFPIELVFAAVIVPILANALKGATDKFFGKTSINK